MSGYKYSSKIENAENSAKALGLALPLSTKKSIEICNFIRGKKVSQAIKLLDNAIELKDAIPFKRFNKKISHKGGQTKGPGRYPIKTCLAIKKVIKSAESNALSKGLNSDSLIITHIKAQKAAGQWHYGRQRRRRMKRSHIEVIVQEKETKKKEKKHSIKKTEKTKVVKEKTQDKKVQQKNEEKKTE